MTKAQRVIFRVSQLRRLCLSLREAGRRGWKPLPKPPAQRH